MATSSQRSVLPVLAGSAARSWQKPGDVEILAARESSHLASKAEAVMMEGGLEGY